MGSYMPLHFPFAVWRGCEACARKETKGARNDRRFVADDVAEQVARDDNTIQRSGILYHQHRRAINQMMSQLQLRELFAHHIRDSLTPQPRRRHHIGLIQAPDRQGRVLSQRQVSRQPRHTLDLHSRVGFRVHREARSVVLLPLAEVDSACKLTHDVEVHSPADLGFQGRDVYETVGDEEAWPQISERSHFLSKLEDALLGANGGGAPFWPADSSEEDGVGGFGCF